MLDYGARFLRSKSARWTTPDPLAEKYCSTSPYAFCANNPVRYVDPDGREIVKKYVGTIQDFVVFMNSLKTGIGISTGSNAHAAMLRMGATKGLKPANTAPFNTSNSRYIYTEIGGRIDMSHFMFYAGRAYYYKLDKIQANEFVNNNALVFMSSVARMHFYEKMNLNPVRNAVRDGFLQEFADQFMAPHSAYSYEDLPSDRFGADFGANYFDPNSKNTFSEQLQSYFIDVLKALKPHEAPNYHTLPDDYLAKPSRTNKSVNPVYVNSNL